MIRHLGCMSYDFDYVHRPARLYGYDSLTCIYSGKLYNAHRFDKLICQINYTMLISLTTRYTMLILV